MRGETLPGIHDGTLMSENLQVHELRGNAITPWMEALGGLRIRVFRDYPYLYDGTMEYELEYLKVYLATPDSLLVLVTDEAGNAVGATTCLPLEAEGPEFLEPFLRAGADVANVMYFGESILLPEWRGQGIGKLFFDRREAHARALGKKVTAFCAVDRPADHPLRPEGYRPLDTFWEERGYVKQPHLQASFIWKETGEEPESPKTLTFWTRSWDT